MLVDILADTDSVLDLCPLSDMKSRCFDTDAIVDVDVDGQWWSRQSFDTTCGGRREVWPGGEDF